MKATISSCKDAIEGRIDIQMMTMNKSVGIKYNVIVQSSLTMAAVHKNPCCQEETKDIMVDSTSLVVLFEISIVPARRS